jgi:hypothetical protein
VAEAASGIQGPPPAACTVEPILKCETIAEYTFSTQQAIDRSELSHYREEAHRICGKAVPSHTQPENAQIRIHGDYPTDFRSWDYTDSYPYLFDCAFPHRPEMVRLKLAFGARIVNPSQKRYRWWEMAQYAGSVGLTFICASILGARAMKARGHEACRRCMTLHNRRTLPKRILIDSGLSFALIGAGGVCFESQILTSNPLERLDANVVNDINYLMRIMWLYSQVIMPFISSPLRIADSPS